VLPPIFAAMANNFLFLPHGFLKSYEDFASFVSGDFLPQTVIFTGAMGKTEDVLKVVADNFYNRHKDDALRLFDQVRQQHTTLMKYLLVVEFLEASKQMQEVFTEVEWLLYDEPVRDARYYTDQIVGTGPVLQAILLAAVLKEQKKKAHWLDSRDILRTDDNFGNAQLLANFADLTTAFPFDASAELLVMPWTVGSTYDNETTRYAPAEVLKMIQEKAPGANCQVL